MGDQREVAKRIKAVWGGWKNNRGNVRQECFRCFERTIVQDNGKAGNVVWDRDISCYKGAEEKDASSRNENFKVVTGNYKEGQG